MLSVISSTQQNSMHLISLSIVFGSILTIALVSAAIIKLFQYFTKQNQSSSFKAWLNFLKQAGLKPFLLFSISYIIYLLILSCYLILPQLFVGYEKTLFNSSFYLLRSIELIAFFWFILKALHVGQVRLLKWLSASGHHTIRIIFPMVSQSLRAAIFLLMVNILMPSLGLSGSAAEGLEKLAEVLLILVLGWIFVQVVNSLAMLILSKHRLDYKNDPASRKINTQVIILKRVILTIGFIVIIASILMVFDSVKKLGTGLLTTAGIISAVGAFASQQSLSRLFAGLQIAFTQPIRIGDTIMIDNELGQIEEITLSYIVVKLWDLRHLILPTDYFMNKGLQNLTRTSSDLLGTVFFYTDYTFPVEDLRQKFLELINQSPLWDRKRSSLQVTDINQGTMQIRALISASNSTNLFDLRCFIRENLMHYIVENHSAHLPKVRNANVSL